MAMSPAWAGKSWNGRASNAQNTLRAAIVSAPAPSQETKAQRARGLRRPATTAPSSTADGADIGPSIRKLGQASSLGSHEGPADAPPPVRPPRAHRLGASNRAGGERRPAARA